MPPLRDLTAALEAAVNDHLGDEVTYTPASGSPLTFNAWVEFDNEEIRGGGSLGQARGVLLIEVSKSIIPSVNVAEDRITIAVKPGETYKPANVLEGAGGATWRLPLAKVRNA
jgi:hypothetical protein